MSWCSWSGRACSAWPGKCRSGLVSWVPSLIPVGGGDEEGEEEESWGRESSSGYRIVSFDSAGQCMVILKGKPGRVKKKKRETSTIIKHILLPQSSMK